MIGIAALEIDARNAVVGGNDHLRLDREEWMRVVEKRSAALQGR